MPICMVMYDGTGRLREDSLERHSADPLTGRSGESTVRDDVTSPIDRDISLIAFQGRVLEEARDERNPLLERVKFLGILGQNLDEFAMARGARWAPANKGRIIRGMQALLDDGALLLNRHLVPALVSAGIHLVDYEALIAEERAEVDARFASDILPSITADRCEHGQTRPPVPQLGLNIALTSRAATGRASVAFVRVPDHTSPLVPFTPSRQRLGDTPNEPSQTLGFVWLDQVILGNLGRLLPEETVESAHRFRIVREAECVFDQDCPSEDLAEAVIEGVRQRETNPVVLMVIDRRAGAHVVEALARLLDLPPESIVRARSVPDLKRLWDLSHVTRADLHHRPLRPSMPRQFDWSRCRFAAIRSGDILLHHPYESFQPVVDLFRQAASDPHVLSISTTLYRTDRYESPIAEALLEAARVGKKVRVVVELQARFDELRNAEWTRRFRAAGAEVCHSPARFKVHAKLTLIERREGDVVRRYVHLSSGNYNSFTATVYTDLALMTCDEAIGADVAELFDAVTGGDAPRPMQTLLAAPFGLRTGFNALVEREIAWVGRGEAGHIVLKMNALTDSSKIQLLQRASRAGVRVDLLVRGVCSLIPGVAGVSDRIRVVSIVGRFLEHSRAWYFRNGGEGEVWIGSADLMPRNFDRRVEVVVPLKDPALVSRVRDQILGTYLADTVLARELRRDGAYARVKPRPGEPAVWSQAVLQDPAFA